MSPIFTPRYSRQHWVAVGSAVFFTSGGILLIVSGRAESWEPYLALVMGVFGISVARKLVREIRFGPHSLIVDRYFGRKREIPYAEIASLGAAAVATQQGRIDFVGMENVGQLADIFNNLREKGEITESQLDDKLATHGRLGWDVVILALVISVAVAEGLMRFGGSTMDVRVLVLLLYVPSLISVRLWLRGRARSTSAIKCARDAIAHLDSYLESLARAPSRNAFLSLDHPDSSAFVQFKHYDGKDFEFSFFILTDRQRSLEEQILQAGERLGLTARPTEIDDGCILNFDCSGEPAEVARMVRQFLADVFQVSESVEVSFCGTEVESGAS